MINIFLIPLCLLLFLTSCSSKKIKTHQLNPVDEEFNQSFSTEGRDGDHVILIGTSYARYPTDKTYILFEAEKNLREKLMDYIPNDSTLRTKIYSQGNQRTINSSLQSSSILKGVVFKNYEKITDCKTKQLPSSDLTFEMITECRVRYKFPLSLIGE